MSTEALRRTLTFLTAFAQTFAARLLTTLEHVVGERRVSLRLVLVSLLSSLCVLSATYLKVLLVAGAQVPLFYKYGGVFVAALAGLATTTFRARNWGLTAFALLGVASSVLAYPALLVLTIPGLVFTPPLLLATRSVLRSARASRGAAVWLAALVAAPFVGLELPAWSVSPVYEGEPGLVAFFIKLGLSAAVSCNLLLSVGAIAAVTWACLCSAAVRTLPSSIFRGRCDDPGRGGV